MNKNNANADIQPLVDKFLYDMSPLLPTDIRQYIMYAVVNQNMLKARLLKYSTTNEMKYSIRDIAAMNRGMADISDILTALSRLVKYDGVAHPLYDAWNDIKDALSAQTVDQVYNMISSLIITLDCQLISRQFKREVSLFRKYIANMAHLCHEKTRYIKEFINNVRRGTFVMFPIGVLEEYSDNLLSATEEEHVNFQVLDILLSQPGSDILTNNMFDMPLGKPSSACSDYKKYLLMGEYADSDTDLLMVRTIYAFFVHRSVSTSRVTTICTSFYNGLKGNISIDTRLPEHAVGRLVHYDSAHRCMPNAIDEHLVMPVLVPTGNNNTNISTNNRKHGNDRE